MSENTLPDRARFTWGGDETLFIEIDEAMSLAANLRSLAMARGLRESDLPGIVDICPANASLLVRFDPDELSPSRLEGAAREIETAAQAESDPVLRTRIIELPVWYQDPFTAEVTQRFREGYHQDPSGSDVDYAARINGLADAAEFVRRHHSQPWMVSMVGFVAGLPFLYQLVERSQQLEVPKYLSPRTDTPPLTLGHGGCFGAIYSVRGAGGYQMFGIAAAPIFDPSQRLADFEDNMVFFRPSDVVRFKPVEQDEYESIQEQVKDGSFRYRIAPVEIDTPSLLADPQSYNSVLMEALG